MGNTGSANTRDRHKSCDIDIISPHRDQSQAFVFDKNKSESLDSEQGSEAIESNKNRVIEAKLLWEANFRRQKYISDIRMWCSRTLQDSSSSQGDGATNSSVDGNEKNSLLPTVFKWEGGGKDVFISGTFSDWKPVPMVKR